jgi:hypothetical protein
MSMINTEHSSQHKHENFYENVSICYAQITLSGVLKLNMSLDNGHQTARTCNS